MGMRMALNFINSMHMIMGAIFTGMFMLVSIDDGIMRLIVEMGMRVFVCVFVIMLMGMGDITVLMVMMV
jgi:hypothetical protein